MLTSKIKNKLIDIFGRDKVLEEDLDKFTYSYDGSFIPLLPARKPDIIVKAKRTEQITKLMALANEHKINIVPRGIGSGRTGGSIPVDGGIVLCLDEMNKIIEFDDKNLMITVEPGVRTADIYEYCAQKGLFYPPDPSSFKYSTIGGNVAENAGGARAVKYGVTKDYVVGLEIVLADGRILKTGGKAIKNVTGYNLTQLFVGSEGTLGIITKITLRLIPMPKKRKTIQVMFSSLDGASEAVTKIIHSGTVPSAAEIMDKLSIEAVAKFRKFDIDPNVEAAVIFEIDGDNETLLEEQAKQLEEICYQCDATAVKVAKNKQEEDELWSLRRGMGPAVAAIAPNKIGEDISVPRAALPKVIRELREIADRHELKLAVFGHAGDGNLHPSFLTDLSIPGEQEKMDKAVDETFKLALEVGGTLSGEHGIGITKKPYIYDALGDVGLDTLQMIKKALDPNNIINPGKIF